jgi:hypothetical protein
MKKIGEGHRIRACQTKDTRRNVGTLCYSQQAGCQIVDMYGLHLWGGHECGKDGQVPHHLD